MGIFRGGDTGAAAAADADDSLCDGSRRYEIFFEEVSGGAEFGSNCEVQHIGSAGRALWPPDHFVHPSPWAPGNPVDNRSCGSHRGRLSGLALWQEG